MVDNQQILDPQSELDALTAPGVILRHYKGGIYRERVVAKLTDDAKAGEAIVVYEHLWPHEHTWFARPKHLFDEQVENQPRFQYVKWDPVLTEDQVFFCDCHDEDHVFKLSYEHTDGDLYFSAYLYQGRNVFKRVWEALKYVFNQKARWGHWATTIVKGQDLTRLKLLIDKAYAAQFNYTR